MQVISESPTLREFVIGEKHWTVGDAPAREGLLLGRPAADEAVGLPSWVLYESGSVVLRRSRVEADVIKAAGYHLATLAAASTSSLLALRVRTVVLPDGDVWLFDANVLWELAGLDRRLGARGFTVLPTTSALVDPESGEVVLPECGPGMSVPKGRLRIARLILRNIQESGIEGAERMLALARSVLRTSETDLQLTLGQLGLMTQPQRGLVELLPSDAIESQISHLGSS